ncbi:homoserine dehydrogenase [Saprolegnia parasitica CBS 223.65]|uniref:Homoserine dehydrogenase n=1 Tax=Saprolegnia parasitica (strain CBS 223.65) TaxID=695850 RepID=A0A067BM40_SAPPC|nr:homoserine dehydrogenase [Saprolegnia parasitica CBS 223.65]KDO15792.1 homoserine dehydrogenase [Saprolegnia parasitica CBS 223.65]|eukprot:XP_012213499.1 homoserine dehydrogenase [Saprolegnia parasitica CBS 223.65]
MDALHRGSPFSEAVVSAYENGLTEDDPRDDLSGRVAARKMLILARELGHTTNMASVLVQDLTPPSMHNLSLSAFFAGLPQLDAAFEAQLNDSRASNTVLMYTGRLDADGAIRVGLEHYDRHSSFHRLQWTESLFALTTEWFPDAIVLKGAGAGTNGTVASLMADIAKLSCVLFTACDLTS